MEEIIFPPSPSWFLPNIISCREDGSISYGSKNSIVILKVKSHDTNNSPETLIIRSAHSQKVTSVAFSPENCDESFLNTIVSCSDDGLVKLWKIDSMTSFLGHKSHWQQKEEVGKVLCLDWSKANPHYIVSAADNNTLVLWNICSNTTIKFFFYNLGTTVIACCPFNEKTVAVGRKTGQIYIINLTGNGEIIYKLRGHDNRIHSLTWCPAPYNIFNVHEVYEEFLLASACQDKEVFIWKAGSDGKCEIKFQIPSNPISKRDVAPAKLGNTFSYCTLFWSDPYKIYFSSNFGELIYFDVKSYLTNKPLSSIDTPGQKLNKHTLSCFKLGHCFHSKGLFAISGSIMKNQIILYNDLKVKSNLKFKIQTNGCNVIDNSETESEIKNKFNWEVKTSESSQLIWTTGQDRKLIGCKFNCNKLEMVYSFHTLNGFVYNAVVCPHDPNKIAIGVGDGMIRLWNLTEKNGDMQIYWKKIKDRVMALAWHPTKDGLLAYGTSDGRVGLIDTNSNKLPSVFKPAHPNPIYVLSWGPQFSINSVEDFNSKSEFNLYSVGDNTLSVYIPYKLNSEPINLSKVLNFPCKKQTDVCWKPDYSLMAVGNEDGSICLVESTEFKIVHTLFAYKKLIKSIAWHPPSTSIESGVSSYHGYLTSASTDNANEIRVFNCENENNQLKVQQVASLKGHYGNINSVSWCPHISGRLVSTSADCSVQIWDVITQTPIINFSSIGMPILSLWSPVDSDVILTGCKTDLLHVWKISLQIKSSPTPHQKVTKPKKDKNIQFSELKEIVSETKEIIEEKKENLNNIAIAEAKSSKNIKETKMFSKAWKRDTNDQLKACYFMLKENETDNSKVDYSLPFLCNESDIKTFIKCEGDSFKNAKNWTEYNELFLWSGSIKDILEECIKNGELNDFLVSLAPVVSPRLWQEACLSYSKSLADKKLYRKAASYLVVCHKVYEAVEMLAQANLYLEALCIARSRLPKSDPIIKQVIEQYAKWLLKNGATLKAFECYVFLEDYLEAAKLCRKKNQPEYLSLAALAARKCDSSELECLDATNALLKCFELNDFDLAQRICNDHFNLKHLSLMFNVYHIIHQLDESKLILEKDLVSYIKESNQIENVIFPSALQQLYQNYTVYKNKKEMLIIVAQELCYACVAEDTEVYITHLIKALSTCSRYLQSSSSETHPLYKLCTWLCPHDLLAKNSCFVLSENLLFPKIKSLRAFLCSAIARYLNDNLTNENILFFLDTLTELKDDLLDEDSFKYFKNLLKLVICKKRLMTNRDKMIKRKLANEENKLNNDKMNLDNSKESVFKSDVDSVETSSPEKTVFQSCENENNSDFSESNNILNSFEDSECCDDIQEKISEDMELQCLIKNEIERFEKVRISSPNPVPVYSMLKNILENVHENESAKILLKDLETRYLELIK